MTHYGDSFGDQELQTSFPVRTNIVTNSYSWMNSGLQTQGKCHRNVEFIRSRDDSAISRLEFFACTTLRPDVQTGRTQLWRVHYDRFLTIIDPSRRPGTTVFLPLFIHMTHVGSVNTEKIAWKFLKCESIHAWTNRSCRHYKKICGSVTMASQNWFPLR